ncbi:MAG: hypothetical protein GEU98_16160 [Pseudonocardiaceae bacterium]|nr:hypothetical protein [Pseudonocardiaceae bacterium]
MRSAWRGRRLPVLLIVVAVLLTGFGAWSTVRAYALRSSESADNQALVDAEATAEVNAAVSNSLNKVFSYSFDKTEATEQAAKNGLRGQALETYNALFDQVRELAPKQRIMVTTRVVRSGMKTLTDDRARLLVFLDQSASRADGGGGNDSNSSAAAQLSVTAERHGDSWLITEIDLP